jgi:hypothetical protein
MLATMFLSKLGKVAVHIILPCHLCAFREMVYLLEPSHRMVDRALDVAASPDHNPILLNVSCLSEPIVFECEPN